jgi:hypothetical protein
MKTITVKLKDKSQDLQIGANYKVKQNGSKNATGRIFKGIESGILDIPFLVFSTKVNKEATATIKEDGKYTTTTYHNLKHTSLPNEIVIPYYDIISIN